MSNQRRGTLPSGFPPVSAVPGYLTQAVQRSSANESAGSNESFISQVPQPYHTNSGDLPGNGNYRAYGRSKTVSPDFQSGKSTGRHRSSSETSKLQDTGARPNVQGSSPLMGDAPSFQPSQRPRDDNMDADEQRGRDRGPRNNTTSQQHGISSYQPANHSAAQYPRGSYGNGAVNNMNARYAQPQTAPQDDGYASHINPGPYSHYGPGAFPNYSRPQPVMSPQTMNQPSMNPGNFGRDASYEVQPPSRQHNAPGHSNQNFQNQPHNNPGGNRGVGGYAGGQGFSGPGYVVPYVQPQQVMNNTGRFQPQNSGQNPIASTSLPVRNRQDQRPGNRYNAQNTGFGGNHTNFAVRTPQNVQHSSNHGSGHGDLNYAHFPDNSRVNFGPPPQQRTDFGARVSGNQNRVQLPRSTPVRVSEGPNNNASSAPTGRPTRAAEDFTSDPRFRTPQLRSRRGQTIADHSPVRNNLTAWLDNVPVETSSAVINTPRSPPKPLDYSLAVAGEDPFTSPSDGKMSHLFPVSNPFGSYITPLQTVRAANDASRMFDNNTSPQLRRLTNNGTRTPSINELLDMANLPFVEYCRSESKGPDDFGVIKIKNIPYGVSRQEILAFMGRNARLVAEFEHEPVHIVMERVTSKTLDCYVEFTNMNEAIGAVARFETNRNGGRSGRLGQRHVEIELSSQEALMKDLFPKAKNVNWAGGRARIIPTDPNDPYNSGFQGFVSKEELVMLVKHVEAPQRSPFSKDCPQRPFECLISTLLKYPWYMVDHVTIEDRARLHETTKSLATILYYHVENNREDIRLTAALLKRVWRAALACPGFTPTMKDDIAFICNIDTSYSMELGLPPRANEWLYLLTIGPKKSAPVDLLMYYINLIRNTTIQQRPQLSLAEQSARGESVDRDRYTLFGDLKALIVRPPGHLRLCTLAQIARVEWVAIETALRRALTPAIQAPPQ